MSLHIVDRENSLRLLQNLVQMFEGPLHGYEFYLRSLFTATTFLPPSIETRLGLTPTKLEEKFLHTSRFDINEN